MAEPLSVAEVHEAMSQLDPEWALVDGRLHRDLTFADFVEAFAFMTGLALVAQRLDHHPDWSNAWNRVSIDITSHDAGGLTATCFKLAEATDRLAAGRPR